MASFTDYTGREKDRIGRQLKESPDCKIQKFQRTLKTTGAMEIDLTDLAIKLKTLVPSSTGVELVFSSIEFNHTDLHNRLGYEEVSKLASCLRALSDLKKHFLMFSINLKHF